MLDELTEADSELHPKAAGHLTHEDLEAYASGRLDPARLSDCQTHLGSCEACRAELEDLRLFQSDLAGFARSEPDRRESQRHKQRRALAMPLVASVATVCVAAAVATVLWRRHESPRTTHKTPVPAAASVTRAPVGPSASPATPPAVSNPTRDTRLADEIAALPDDVRARVSDAIQHGRLQLPTDVSRIHRSTPTSTGTPQAHAGFSLLGPFGEATSETRPEFSWQPLEGAVRYSVVIVDVGLHPVQRSPSLRKTVWRPRRHLRRGRTYLWQVTATLRGGSKVVASSPAPSEATLRVVPLKLADDLAHFRQGHPDAHLVLGALYAQAGMLSESTDELRKVPPGDSSYKTAQAWLASLSSPDQ